MIGAIAATQSAWGALSWNTVAVAVGTGVVLAGDVQLRDRFVPSQAFAIKLPKLGVPKLPSLPSLPKLSLGKGKAPPTAAPTSKTGTRTPARGSAPTGVRVRPATPQANLPSGPTYVDPAQARIMDQGKGWKAFPGRRLPGKNMEQFLDMARSLRS